VVGPPEVAWKDLTKDQRGKFMKAVVTAQDEDRLPDLRPKKFEKFNCATCHGKDAKEREFKMPNPNADIHALPDSPEGFKALMAKKPDWPKLRQVHERGPSSRSSSASSCTCPSSTRPSPTPTPSAAEVPYHQESDLKELT
jgi:hypothetical protein